MRSVLGVGRRFSSWINQEAREGGVPALVAVNGVALLLLTVQPHLVPLAERQHQALALHLPPLGRVLIKHHGLHLPAPRHQLHRKGLPGVFPHREGKEVHAGEATREQAGGFVEVGPYVDVFHVEGQRWPVLVPAALTQECGCSRHGEGRLWLLRLRVAVGVRQC